MFFLSTLPKRTTVTRTLFWTVLARFGVPQNMTSIVRQLYEGMRTCVRLDDGVISGCFIVEKGLRQRCVLAPLQFNVFYAFQGGQIHYHGRHSQKVVGPTVKCFNSIANQTNDHTRLIDWIYAGECATELVHSFATREAIVNSAISCARRTRSYGSSVQGTTMAWM